jgi:hypothetical protein
MSRVAAGAVAASAIALSLLVAPVASGQTPAAPERDSFWFSAGLGVGSEDVAGSLNAAYQFGANVISLRNTATAGLFDDGFSDYAVLFGRATRPAGKRYHLSGALGVGVVDGCTADGFLGGCDDTGMVVGLPLEVQASWRPGRWAGLALYGFANFNQTRSFAGLTLALQLGRMR